MTPEAGHFLARASKLLDDAEKMLSINLFDAGGRTAYLGAFHAAQALIFEEDQRIVKTHNGVHTTSQMLLRDDATLAPDLRHFLSQTYLIKRQADYGFEPGGGVSKEDAEDALERATRYVAHIRARLVKSTRT